MVAKRFLISGRVQGVGFRYFVLREAQRIGPINGYVRNTWDGRVEVYAEAEPQAMNELESILRRGPHSARVTQVEISEEVPEEQFKNFQITH
jgi:acylphosphatase